jgi:Ca2+-binding RTX toxin-like protein
VADNNNAADTFGGIYAQSNPLLTTRHGLSDTVYASEHITGVSLNLVWGVIEPTNGTYNWATLDGEIAKALANGKEISLAVTPNRIDAPGWMFDTGAEKISLPVAKLDGQMIDIAAPWDAQYQAQYAEMMQALSDHLKTIPGAYEAVTAVKITGINQITPETRLPVSGPNSDATAIWQAAGYTPDKIIDAWKGFAAATDSAFSDKVLGIEVLNSNAFPRIDNDGQLVAKTSPTYVDVTQEIVSAGLEMFEGRFLVQYDGLGENNVSPVVSGAADSGAIAGYQTNHWTKSGAGDGLNNASAEALSQQGFQDILEAGISSGARYIEVWANDAVRFPDAIAHAQSLMDSDVDTSVLAPVALNIETATDFNMRIGVATDSLVVTGGSEGLKLGGNEYNNRIFGGAGDDVISGGAGDDTLSGGAGDDRLSGGVGNDLLRGGTGNDTYVVSDSATVIEETAGQGSDTVIAFAEYRLAAGVSVETLRAGASNLTLVGNELDNNLIGSAGDDLLNGGGGDDVITGKDGRDVMIGGNGNDRLNGGSSADRMVGGSGDDTYVVNHSGATIVEIAGEGEDTITTSVDFTLAAGVEVEVLKAAGGNTGLTLVGNEFDNRIKGAAGADRLSGDDGNDTLDGQAGADTLTGGRGDDIYHVDRNADVIVEATGEGNDTVLATASYNLKAGVEVENLFGREAGLTLRGNEFSNKITAEGGGNILDGNGGNDTLIGGSGSDTLIGGAGKDNLTGGAGADVFAFQALTDSAPGVFDVIRDFVAGLDKVDLSAIDANAGVTGNQAFSFIGSGAFTSQAGQLRAAHTGNNTTLTADVNGDGSADFQIQLIGTHTLTAGDFML